MKKTILIASLSLIAFASYAQLRVGVQAGASTSIPNLSIIPDAKSVTFIQPGIIFDYQIAGLISIRPSINYLRSGFTTESLDTVGPNIYKYVDKLRTDNLLIPIDLVVPIKLGSGKLLLSAGPSLVVGLQGNQQSTTTINGIASTPINTPIKFGNTIFDLKQINWGTNFGIGYAFSNGLDIRAIYNLGLTNIQGGLPSGVTTKNDIVSLMLAYYIIK